MYYQGGQQGNLQQGGCGVITSPINFQNPNFQSNIHMLAQAAGKIGSTLLILVNPNIPETTAPYALLYLPIEVPPTERKQKDENQ